jgi:putative nucleotidyltransferase with HDIG domain
LRHSTGRMSSSIRGLSTTAPQNLTNAENGVEGTRRSTGDVSVLAYTSTSAVPITRGQDSTRPLADAASDSETRDLERYRLIAAFLITVLYVLMLGIMVYISMGQADIGLTTERDQLGRQVVTWVVPNGLGYDQQVHTGDIIKSDETDVSGARTVVIQPVNGVGRQEMTVTTAGHDGGTPVQRWAYALLGLIFIGVGGPVYVKARQRTAATAFYVFCVATAMALATAIAVPLVIAWVLATQFVVMVFWAGSFAFFFFKFPVRVGRTEGQHNAIMLALVVTGMAVVIAYAWVALRSPNDYSFAQTLLYLYLAGWVAAGLISLIWSAIAERSQEIRQQFAILLGGTAIAVGPSLVLGLIPYMLMGQPIINIHITALALGLMPMAFAYAITQHQLLGIRSLVRRSVVYVVTGSSVLLVFSVAAATLGAIVPEGWEKKEWGLIGFGFFVFLIALSFGYLQRRVEHLVDRYIYHDAYDYKEALLQFSAQLAAEQQLHILSDQLVERTCRLMNLTCGVLLLATHLDSERNAGTLQESPLEDALSLSYFGKQMSTYTTDSLAKYITGPLVGRSVPPAEAILRGGGQAAPGSYLVPYAKYGDCADWLIDGLQSELSELGISLQEPDASMHLIYLGDNEDYISQSDGHKRAETQELNGRGNSSEPGSIYGTVALPTDGRTITRNLDYDSVRSFLGVPLWTRSRFVGVLCLGGKKTGERFTKDDLSLLSTLGSQAALAIYNAQLYEAREQALLDTIAALAHAIEAKDGYTINHCERMVGRAVGLALEMRLPRKEVENIRLGAILHDVGKIGIPDAVLNKPGRLTPEEYEIMKQHAAIGARIVQSVAALQPVVPIVRHHQERYDGSGYPDGLSGEAIPLGARIISVVDAYGAMTEDRVYRNALGHEKAIEELTTQSGRQFDPQVVDAFLRLVREQPEFIEQ